MSLIRRATFAAIIAALAFGLVDGRAATPAKKTADKPKTQKVTTKSPQTKGKAGKQAVAPPTSRAVDDPQKEQSAQTAERDSLTARIAALKQQIAAGEKSRTGAAAALVRAQKSLDDVNRRIAELAQRQRAAQERIASLDQQRAGTESRIVARRAALTATATELAVRTDPDPLQILVMGSDPNEPVLTEAYLGYIARAQAADLASLRDKASDLQAQRQRADADTQALVQQAEAQKTARETLAADQASQRQALAQLSQTLSQQRKTASAMEADEKRLTRVVEELQRMIERQAAEERARREAAKKLAEQKAAAARNRSATREPTPKERSLPQPAGTATDAVPDESTGNGSFARLRGQLRLPVRGSIVGRYGAARGGSGATWKGVFVKTEAGADVRAVAAGRVVFADDLRGFGNLLIVDHGDQYLSIYGNNETLLKHTGDAVAPGDVISTAGNSSGDEQTGLYFELRFRGKPFDPMSWTGGR